MPAEAERTTRKQRIDPRHVRWTVTPLHPGMPASAYRAATIEEYETANTADYALCDDGQVRGVLEAKRFSVDENGSLVAFEYKWLGLRTCCPTSRPLGRFS